MNKITLFIVFLIMSCGNPTYTDAECDYIESFFIKDEFNFIFIKDRGRPGGVYTFQVTDLEKDSLYLYKNLDVWPSEVMWFLEKEDTLRKIKGDSILYIMKKDTVLEYHYACDQSYINGRPIMEILKEKGIK